MAVFQIKQPSSRLGTAQSMTLVASTSQQLASTFGSETFQILVVAGSATNIVIGNGTLTATTSGTLVPANFPMYFTVTPGQSLAAISSGTGPVSVTEVS